MLSLILNLTYGKIDLTAYLVAVLFFCLVNNSLHYRVSDTAGLFWLKAQYRNINTLWGSYIDHPIKLFIFILSLNN